MVAIGFYIPTKTNVILRRDLGMKSHLELEKLGMELTTPGLQGDWFNHYTMEAADLHFCFSYMQKSAKRV